MLSSTVRTAAKRAAQHVNAHYAVTSRCMSAFPGVYDPIADQNYEPPARETVRMPRFADFRSDTVTKPTAEMTIAMIDAQVGDDVYGEDPTVNKLQALAAQMLEKEAALFVPSGTMANLLAIAAQAGRGEEVIVGDEQHIFRYEQCGVSTLFSVPIHTLANKPDGTFALEGKHSLAEAIASRGGGKDPHFTKPAVVALENTHNRCGGVVLPQAFVEDVADMCAEHGLKLHMDGARLMNAAAATKLAPAKMVKRCDTVNLCLSKGLGAPVGSLIVGNKQLIDSCRRLRKLVGGGMRQAGVVAAAGIVALKEHPKLLASDHSKAKSIAHGLSGIPGLIVEARKVQTNIIFVELDTAALSVEKALAKVKAGDPESPPEDVLKPDMLLADAFGALLEAAGKVKVGCYGTKKLRVVTHHQIRDEDVDSLLDTATKVAAWLS